MKWKRKRNLITPPPLKSRPRKGKEKGEESNIR